MDGQLSATAREVKYQTVRKGVEELDAKLRKAKSLKEKVSKLKLSGDFCPAEDLNQIFVEMTAHMSIINNSATAESKIASLEGEIALCKEKIAEIKSTATIILAAEKVEIKTRIEELQKTFAKANRVQEEILKVEKDSGFCSDDKIEKMQKEFDSVHNIFRNIQPLNQGIK